MADSLLLSQALPELSSATLVTSPSPTFLTGHISTSALPNGRFLEMWVMHSKDAKPLEIGSCIVIGRSSADLAKKDQKIDPLPTAVITGIAYCNDDQIIFRISISQPFFPSLLSAPLHAARIGKLRKVWHQIRSWWLPLPPPLPRTLGNRRTKPSNHRSEEDWWRTEKLAYLHQFSSSFHITSTKVQREPINE